MVTLEVQRFCKQIVSVRKIQLPLEISRVFRCQFLRNLDTRSELLDGARHIGLHLQRLADSEMGDRDLALQDGIRRILRGNGNQDNQYSPEFSKRPGRITLQL